MVVAREGRWAGRLGRGGLSWSSAVMALDWNRVLLEARGLHMVDHGGDSESVCGLCVRNVLLMEDDGRVW